MARLRRLTTPAVAAISVLVVLMLGAILGEITGLGFGLSWVASSLRAARSAASGSGCPSGVQLTVVYNALVWPGSDWRAIIGPQLRHLHATGLQACAEVHVSLSRPESHPGYSLQQLAAESEEAAALVHSMTGGSAIRVHTFPGNMYEYPGLRLLWDLSQEVPKARAASHFFLYFHSKGMVFHEHEHEGEALPGRLPEEFRLFYGTIERWRDAIRALSKHPASDLAGIYPAPGGYIWFNFWWARASYLHRMKPPRVTEDRFYYESWLGDDVQGLPASRRNCATCWSMCTNSMHTYDQPEAAEKPECAWATPEMLAY